MGWGQSKGSDLDHVLKLSSGELFLEASHRSLLHIHHSLEVREGVDDVHSELGCLDHGRVEVRCDLRIAVGVLAHVEELDERDEGIN